MNASLLDAPRPPAPLWAEVSAVSPRLWRVSDRRGRIVGHIRAHLCDTGWRFSAERFSSTEHAFRALGDFWRADDALECLRYLR